MVVVADGKKLIKLNLMEFTVERCRIASKAKNKACEDAVDP